MARQTLTEEERMNMIFGLQIRIDMLKKETGVLSGALPAEAAPAPPLPAAAVLPKVLAVKGIKPDIIFEKDKKRAGSRERTQ